jgi:hypothetical protein
MTRIYSAGIDVARINDQACRDMQEDGFTQ